MNRRCYGPPLEHKSITTIGWQGEQNLQATAMVLLSSSFTAVEQKPFLITIIGQKSLKGSDYVEHSSY